ncbi:MAG: hypothetical protein J6E40_14200 [Lachnospiraceae bacterium]|nr:hypothetical protein [Lachnospiraceae bacterium]
MRIKKRDLTGSRFGKLVVLNAISEDKEGYGASLWRCRCDCGKEINVTYFGLVSGNNKSCGCLKEESQKSLLERMELVDGTCVEWLKDRKIRTDNKSGCKGVYKRKSGKYTVSIGFKKKIIYLGTYESRDEAIEARKKAEELVYDSFLEGYSIWKKRAEQDPEWAKGHPFRFDVEKKGGRLVVHNPMVQLAE